MVAREPLARLGHLNLMEFSRELTRWGGGRLEERDGVLLFASGSTMPVLVNGAFRLTDDVAAGSMIKLANAFFSDFGRGYSVMARATRDADDLPAPGDAPRL